MNAVMYGGDEVGAIVLDLGSHTIRGGFGGEDTPKADFRSTVGVLAAAEQISDGSNYSKCYIDTVATKVPRESVEIVNFIKDGLIDDWDIFEKVFEYFYGSYMKSTPDQHPLLMSEPPWNAKDKREKLTELLFEKYNVPAFFLCKNSVLSSFSYGRSTCLLLDSGATHTSAVPIYDGHVITQAVTRTPLGGNFIVEECKNFLAQENIEVVPQYLVASKDIVPEGAKPSYKIREHLTKSIRSSFYQWCVDDIVQDFAHSVLQVSSDYDDVSTPEAKQPIHYEFPNGYNKKFGLERFRITECLFDPSFIKCSNYANSQSISQVVVNAIAKTDIDIRPTLYNSIIVVGGNSLYSQFSDRLQADLTNKIPASMKLKINATQIVVERRFSSWIGGSITVSLGSFQQMWFSKQEYEESGKSCIESKCP